MGYILSSSVLYSSTGAYKPKQGSFSVVQAPPAITLAILCSPDYTLVKPKH